MSDLAMTYFSNMIIIFTIKRWDGSKFFKNLGVFVMYSNV
jgi:hypothetical protein